MKETCCIRATLMPTANVRKITQYMSITQSYYQNISRSYVCSSKCTPNLTTQTFVANHVQLCQTFCDLRSPGDCSGTNRSPCSLAKAKKSMMMLICPKPPVAPRAWNCKAVGCFSVQTFTTRSDNQQKIQSGKQDLSLACFGWAAGAQEIQAPKQHQNASDSKFETQYLVRYILGEVL